MSEDGTIHEELQNMQMMVWRIQRRLSWLPRTTVRAELDTALIEVMNKLDIAVQRAGKL